MHRKLLSGLAEWEVSDYFSISEAKFRDIMYFGLGIRKKSLLLNLFDPINDCLELPIGDVIDEIF